MNIIQKGNSPICLTELSLKENTSYEDLKGDCKTEVISQLRSEQSTICAYCDRKMNTTRIEHFIPQSVNRDLDLDYKNFLGVCNGVYYFDRKNNVGIIYCENLRGDQNLKFNPQIVSHINSITFDSDGSVKSSDVTIQNEFDHVLNLNFEELKNERIEAFKRELDNIQEFCNDYDIPKKEGIKRHLNIIATTSHKRFLTEKLSSII